MDTSAVCVENVVKDLTKNNGQGAEVGMESSTFINCSLSSSDSSTGVEKTGIVTPGVLTIFELVNFVVLTQVIGFCGMITNTINFIVFLRQALTDNITLSLLGLAVSDFSASATHVWMCLSINPLFAESGIKFNSRTVQYLTAGWPHVCFSRITSYITAYITFERCLCIVIPLKVKTIITPRRTVFVLVMIYLMTIATIAPVYYVLRLGWVFNEEKNKTWVDLVFVENGVSVENVSLLINACSQITAFVSVIICSLFLVNGLREKSKWRQMSSSANAGQDQSSTRDNKVVKMVSIVATVFIVCYFPSSTNYIFMSAFAEYSIVGRYEGMFRVVWSVLNVLEATNSAVNIVVYYKMSTKYRQEFRRLFCLEAEDHKP